MTLTRRHLATSAAAAGAAAVVAGGWWALVPGGYQALPELHYTLLDRSTTSTSQLRGQVVLVNFWATTCSVCVAEMPQIVATHQRFSGRSFQTVAVAMQYDPPAAVADFAERRGLPFAVAIDNTGALARGFGDVMATPTSFLVNKRGEVVQRYIGRPDFTAVQKLIERLLAEA